MKAVIRVNDAGQAELADFSAIPGSQELRHGEKDTDEEFYNLIAVQKTGENFRGMRDGGGRDENPLSVDGDSGKTPCGLLS